MDTAMISALQSYLRENARQQYESVAVPPFTLFFHPTDTFPNFSYAIPDQPVDENPREALAELINRFRLRGRKPRFEFFEAFAPRLPGYLLEAGFKEEAHQWSMICAPDHLTPVRPPQGVTVTAVGPDSADEDLFGFLLVQRQGFNPSDTQEPDQKSVQQARVDIRNGGWQAFLARVDGQPASTGTFGRIINGVSEIAGIATRTPYRRRGIGTYLAWLLTREAFQQGAEIACLTAEDEPAGRIYQRAGYRPFSIMLAYAVDQET